MTIIHQTQTTSTSQCWATSARCHVQLLPTSNNSGKQTLNSCSLWRHQQPSNKGHEKAYKRQGITRTPLKEVWNLKSKEPPGILIQSWRDFFRRTLYTLPMLGSWKFQKSPRGNTLKWEDSNQYLWSDKAEKSQIHHLRSNKVVFQFTYLQEITNSVLSSKSYLILGRSPK